MNAAILLLAVLCLAVIVGIQVVQTDWFRSYVRDKIVSATEDALGGKVQIQSFSFDWLHLRAEVTDFVIHGTEPPSAAPFFRASNIQVDLRLFMSLFRILSLSAIRVQQPQVNVIVFSDGSLNVPRPPPKQSASDTTPFETVVNLAVGHFELNGGTLVYNSIPRPLDIRGENLQMRLAYNLLTRSYQGELSLQPVYFVQGRQTPVVFTLRVPLSLERDKISLQNATVSTPLSTVTITASIANLKSPETTARVSGTLAIADLNNLAGLSLASGPRIANIAIDADAQVSSDSIKVSKLQIGLGNSRIDAFGVARDPQGAAALNFMSSLDLKDIVRIAKLSQPLTGQLNIDGVTRFNRNIIELRDLRLRGIGGELEGQATLENFARYRAAVSLRGLSLQVAQQRAGIKPLPYDGVVGGALEAQGDLKAPSGGLQVRANLSIAPGRRGVPVSGHLEADYNAAEGDLRASNSYLVLPHSRINLAGSFLRGLRVDLTSRDLADFFVALPDNPPPLRLNNGQVQATALLSGTYHDPRINGHIDVARLAMQDRQFDSLETDFSAGRSQVSVRNGSLRRAMMVAQFNGSLSLSNWRLLQNRPVTLAATVSNGDLADILALAGQKSAGYAGMLNAAVSVNGTLGNPMGLASLTVASGTVAEEPFDQIQMQVEMTDQIVRVPSATIIREQSRIAVTAEYRHPRDSFTTGSLQAHVLSNQIELGAIRNAQVRRTGVAGTFQVDATVAGDVRTGTAFLLTSVSGNFSAKSVRYNSENYGDLTTRVSTFGDVVAYTANSNFAGSQIDVTGRTELKPDYPSNLDVNVNGLPIERVLAAAKRQDIPVRGLASGTVHLAGTVKEPEGQAVLDLRNSIVYDEPIERLRARVAYLPESIEIEQLEAATGPSQLTLTARFQHPRADLQQGSLQFNLQSRQLNLARIRNVQIRRPGLAGALDLSGSGRATLRAAGPHRLDLRGIMLQARASGLSAGGRNLGNADLEATGSGEKLNFTVNSALAGAIIHGQGSATLRGNYPVNAQVSFNNLRWSDVQPLTSAGTPAPFDAITSGGLTIDGPVADADQLNASLRLATLQIRPAQNQPPARQTLVLQNQGDIVFSLQRGQMRVESAHLTGPETDILLTGTVSARARTLDLRLNARANLRLLQTLSPDVYSSGNVTVTAAAQGPIQKPSVNGRMELQNASITSGDLPAGLSNANGIIAFNGNTATIQNLSGESGGGKITLTGFVSRENNLRFAVRANAVGVRVRIQQGVSAVTTATINIAGTTQSSLASGTVTIDRLTYQPQTDIGSILTRSGPPVQSPANPTKLLQNMALDIAVRTSSATAVQASLAQNLQVIANLRVRGRASQPGMTGSIQMNHGQMVFFGATYRLSSGNISFYNPNRVEPLLDITLETQAKGVTVVLAVTGPIDDMKLSYTSDPPLQFEEIVALLASGKPPTSDPTLLANQPTQPPQTFQQRGETALVSKALADPLSNRLQRVFGVSQLKIDPSFTSGSQLPQARVTLQQQVASNLLFTYVTALDDPNTQIVRIEWSMTPQWSATANRDENGVVSINLLYKKQFR